MNAFIGKTVVVTGAASGIGWEIAGLFRDAGATVYAADVGEAAPPGCVAVRADVSNATEVAALIERAAADTGRIDVLCNNAGIGSTKNPVDCSVEEWDQVFAINVRGVFLGTKYALPHMLRQASGCVINTASVAGMIGLRDRAAYCASKGAVIAFTKQVAIQYAGDGVRCNCVCPGTVDSPWVGRLLEQATDSMQARSDLVARQPIGRLGTSMEVARAVLYLASDDAAFMTGSEFVIDGGITAG